jgi:4-alpha-glucanotransferase
MADGQNSPYSALSAMAIDPIYIAVAEIEEFVRAGGERSMSVTEREQLDAARSSRSVDHRTVRTLKCRVLEDAFARFAECDWKTGSVRARGFREFLERERWWLDDYALYRALHAENASRYWIEWDAPVRDRVPEALAQARERLAGRILYYSWVQWIADEQWQRTRRECGGVGIFGDFPFMVSGDSADVWSRQNEFRLEASVGVPPDAFSDVGQDWGLPAYRWDVMAEGGYEWLRQRTRRCAELYDGFRVDHLVGFYRTYVRETDGRTHFLPPDEPSQRVQGERVLSIFGEAGSRIFAEDLGVVPDFVRDSLAALRVAGLKVLRWERDWHAAGKPFRDPADYPVVSVALSGTHDTEPMAEWWDAADASERRIAEDIAALREAGCRPDEPFSPTLRDALLECLFRAASDLLLVPVQDIFGWRDRINTPAIVSDQNWTWRLPWPVEELLTDPTAVERAAFLRALARRHARSR